MKKNINYKRLVFIITLLLIFPTTVSMATNKTTPARSEDTTPPVINIIKPLNKLYYFDRPTISLEKPMIVTMQNIIVEATDDESGVNRVEIYIDGNLKCNDTEAPYTYYWSKFLSGTSVVKVVGYDNAGNSASTEIEVFKLKFTPFITVPVILLILLLLFVGGHFLP